MPRTSVGLRLGDVGKRTLFAACSYLGTIVKQHPHKSPHTAAVQDIVRGHCLLEVFEKFGSSGRTRTYNPSVNSRMLYH